jgi:hypothetical protein
VDLLPPDAVRSGAGQQRQSLELPREPSILTLILNVTRDVKYPDYQLDIVDQAEKTIWSGQGLRPSEANTFTIAVESRMFSAGVYRFRLFGSRSGKRELIHDYVVESRSK